jgi:AraC-like DNA-binding protein
MKSLRTDFEFKGIKPFNFMISYSESNGIADAVNIDSHSHNECEIYINVSGDVSFMVENIIYPVEPGSVIITRPNEFHHCLYNSSVTDHRHFWILFSPEGNEEILDVFFNRASGSGNLISLTSNLFKKVKELCFELIDEKTDDFKRHLCFLELINIFKEGDFQKISPLDSDIPADTLFALNFIQTNLSSNITVAEIAKAAHVSINTLERHFLSTVNMTPSEFIKRRRLALSQSLLRDGHSVQDAAIESGFTDYSRFISVFKEHFGTTPLQFKKSETNIL